MSIILNPDYGLVKFIPVHVLPVHTSQFGHFVMLQRALVHVYAFKIPFLALYVQPRQHFNTKVYTNLKMKYKKELLGFALEEWVIIFAKVISR